MSWFSLHAAPCQLVPDEKLNTEPLSCRAGMLGQQPGSERPSTTPSMALSQTKLPGCWLASRESGQ